VGPPPGVLLVIWPDDCDQEAHRPLTQWVPGGPSLFSRFSFMGFLLADHITTPPPAWIV